MPLKHMVRQICIPALTLAWLALAVASAPAATVIRLPFDRLIEDADLIIKAECIEKQTAWVNGHIETTHKLKVEETLKGSFSEDTLDITMLGGRLVEPLPLTQFVPYQPTFYQGERAVLFLTTKKVKLPADPTGKVEKSGTRLLTTPRIVGLWQGKFTILKDSAKGGEYVTRYSVENLGYVPDDRISARFNRSLQSEITRRKNLPTEMELAGKDWDKMLADEKGGKAERIENLTKEPAHGPRTVGQVKAAEDVPFIQSYEELRARVSGVIKKAEMEKERERARQAEMERLKALDAQHGIAPSNP